MERVAATGSPTGHDTGHVTTSGGPPQATRQVALDDGDDDDEDAAMTIGATTVVREQQVEPMTPFAPTRVLRAQSGDTNSPRPMRPQARSQRNSNAGDAATVRAEMEWGPEDEGWVPKPARLHSGKTKSCAVCFAPLQFSSQQSWDEYLQSEEYLQRLQDNLLSDAFISSVICGEYTGGDLPTEYRMHKNRRMKCRQSVHDFGNMSSAGVSDGSFNEKSSVRILEEMLLNALPTPLLTAVLERRLAVISHSIGIAKRLITQDHIQKKPREFAAPTNNFEMHHLAIQTLAALLQSFNYENDHALPAFEEMARLLAHSPALSLFSFWSPAKKCPEKILPLTRAMVDASSVATTPKLLAAEYAVDGSDGTFWQSQNRPSVTYFNIKCQGLGRVSSIRIQWHLKCVPRTVAIDFRLAGGDSFTFLSEQIGMIGPVQVFETRFPATCEEVRIVMSGVPSVNRSSCYAIEHIKLNTPISNTMFVDPQVTLGVISKWLIDALNHPNEDIVVEAIGALRAWTLATASLSGILYFVDMLLKVGKLFPYEAGRPGVARFAAEQAKLMMDALRTYRADEAEKLAKGKGKKAGNESRKIRALFEPSCCSAGVTVEDGGSAVRTRETSYQYAAVNVGITSGRASWRFRLDNDTVDDEMTCFGAAILPVTVSGYDSSPNLWMLRGYNGNLYARGHKLSRSIGKVHPGDIVQINVDMTEGTLSYKINDTDHGVVFTDIAGHEIYPAVSFYGSGKVITLLGVERWDDTENGNNSIEPVFLSNLRDYHHIVGYGTLGKGNQLGYASASSGASQAGSIQVEGESKQRCLSAHPPSRGDSSVMYDLSEGYDKLLGAVAINDDVQGDVLRQRPISLVFSILGDGKILWQSKPVSQIRAVEKFEVSVKGVRMLDMRVTCSGSNNCAHAIWVDPLLLPLEEWRCRECDTNNKGAMKHCAICGSKCYTDDGSRSSRQDVHIGVEPQEELCFDKVLGKAESPFGTLAATILEELAMIARIDSNVNQDSNQRIKQYLSEGMSSGSSRLRSFERPFSCQPCGEVIKQLIALLKACISEEDSSPSQHGLGVKAITVLELLKVNLLSIAQHDVTTDELGIDVVTRDELRETLEKLAEVHEGGSIKGNIAATVAADTIISGFSVMYTAHQKIQLTLSLLRRHSNESFHVSSPQCKLLSSVLHALAAPGKEGVLTFFQLLKDDDDLGFDFTEDVNEAISSLLALVCDPGSDSSPLDTDSIENDSVMNGAAKLLEAYQLLLFAEAVTLAPKCSSDREVSAKDQRVQIIRNSVQDAAVRFACLVLRSCNGLIERIVADHDDLMLSGSVTNGQHVFGAHRGNLSRVSRLLPWLVSCLCLLRRQSWLALPVLPVMTRFVGTMDRLCSVHQSVKMSESRLRCLELSVKARSMEVQEMERVLASDKALALHHQASKPMYNVFKHLYTGDKDHFDGQIGFQFEATSTFSIIALGRSVNPNKNGGKLVRQHTIRLWEEASQVLVAQVTVSAASRKDALGYAIEPLSVSVKLTQGKLYRLTTQEYAHGGDPWYKKENLPDEEYDPSYIKILRDCYASGSTGFPNSQNLSGAAYGVPTFLVEGADPLEEVPRFISPHGETLLKFSTKRSVPSLSVSHSGSSVHVIGDNDGWRTSLLTSGFCSGIHSIDFIVKSARTGGVTSGHVCVGVDWNMSLNHVSSRRPWADGFMGSTPASIGWMPSIASLWISGRRIDFGNKRLVNTGDILTMVIDFDQQIISFGHNGSPLTLTVGGQESMAKVCMEEQFPSALTPGVSIYGSQDVVQIRPSGIEGSTLRVHWLLDMHNSTASVAGRFAGTLIAGHPVDSVEEELLPWLQSPLLSGGIHMAPVKRFRDECPDWQTALQLEDRLEKSRSSVRSTTSRPVKQLDRLMRGDGPRLVKRASFLDDMGLEEGVLLENLISDMSDTGPAAVIISWLEKVAPDRSFLSRLGNFPLCERLTCAALIKHSPDHILHEVQAIITGTKGGEDPVNLIPSDDFCLLWRRIIMLRHWLIKTRQEYRAKASDMAERAGDEDAVEPRSDKNEEYSYKSVLDMKISIPKDFDELMSDVCERAKFLVLLNPPSEDRERMATESQIALSNLADKWSAQKTPPSLEPMLERWRSLRQSDSTKWSGIVDVLRAQHRWRARRASIQVNNPMAQLPVSASEEVEEDASDRKYRYKDTFAAILKACDLYVRNGVGAPPEILSVLLERRQRRSEYRTFGLDAMKSILSLLTFDSARHNVVIFLRPAFRGFTEDERESRDSNDGQVVAETFRATVRHHYLKGLEGCSRRIIGKVQRSFWLLYSYLANLVGSNAEAEVGSQLKQAIYCAWALDFEPRDHALLLKCGIISSLHQEFSMDTVSRIALQDGSELETLLASRDLGICDAGLHWRPLSEEFIQRSALAGGLITKRDIALLISRAPRYSVSKNWWEDKMCNIPADIANVISRHTASGISLRYVELLNCLQAKLAWCQPGYLGRKVLQFGIYGASGYSSLGSSSKTEHVSCVETPALGEVDDFTFEVWVFPVELNGYRVIRADNGFESGSVYLEFIDRQLQVSVNGNYPREQLFKGVYFDTHQWTHVAVAYHSGSRTVKLYVNGLLADAKVYSIVRQKVVLRQSRIGCWVSENPASGTSSSGERLFKGLIAEFRVWSMTRSDFQVFRDFQRAVPFNVSERSRSQSKLLALWHFDEGEGVCANDRLQPSHSSNQTMIQDSSRNANIVGCHWSVANTPVLSSKRINAMNEQEWSTLVSAIHKIQRFFRRAYVTRYQKAVNIARSSVQVENDDRLDDEFWEDEDRDSRVEGGELDQPSLGLSSQESLCLKALNYSAEEAILHRKLIQRCAWIVFRFLSHAAVCGIHERRDSEALYVAAAAKMRRKLKRQEDGSDQGAPSPPRSSDRSEQSQAVGGNQDNEDSMARSAEAASDAAKSAATDRQLEEPALQTLWFTSEIQRKVFEAIEVELVHATTAIQTAEGLTRAQRMVRSSSTPMKNPGLAVRPQKSVMDVKSREKREFSSAQVVNKMASAPVLEPLEVESLVFGLLSFVLSQSNTRAAVNYLSKPRVLRELLQLLRLASPRSQRVVKLILRRICGRHEVAPVQIADILGSASVLVDLLLDQVAESVCSTAAPMPSHAVGNASFKPPLGQDSNSIWAPVAETLSTPIGFRSGQVHLAAASESVALLRLLLKNRQWGPIVAELLVAAVKNASPILSRRRSQGPPTAGDQEQPLSDIRARTAIIRAVGALCVLGSHTDCIRIGGKVEVIAKETSADRNVDYGFNFSDSRTGPVLATVIELSARSSRVRVVFESTSDESDPSHNVQDVPLASISPIEEVRLQADTVALTADSIPVIMKLASLDSSEVIASFDELWRMQIRSRALLALESVLRQSSQRCLSLLQDAMCRNLLQAALQPVSLSTFVSLPFLQERGRMILCRLIESSSPLGEAMFKGLPDPRPFEVAADKSSSVPPIETNTTPVEEESGEYRVRRGFASTLAAMGFEFDLCMAALEHSRDDPNLAVEWLMGGGAEAYQERQQAQRLAASTLESGRTASGSDGMNDLTIEARAAELQIIADKPLQLVIRALELFNSDPNRAMEWLMEHGNRYIDKPETLVLLSDDIQYENVLSLTDEAALEEVDQDDPLVCNASHETSGEPSPSGSSDTATESDASGNTNIMAVTLAPIVAPLPDQAVAKKSSTRLAGDSSGGFAPLDPEYLPPYVLLTVSSEIGAVQRLSTTGRTGIFRSYSPNDGVLITFLNTETGAYEDEWHPPRNVRRITRIYDEALEGVPSIHRVALRTESALSTHYARRTVSALLRGWDNSSTLKEKAVTSFGDAVLSAVGGPRQFVNLLKLVAASEMVFTLGDRRLDVATRPGATRGLDEPNSVLQNLRFIGLRILEEEANTGKLHAADWLWTKQKESDQKPRREYSGASDSIAEEVYCGQALSSVRDLQLPAGSVDDDFDAELVQAIAMSMQESSRLPEQVIAQEEKEELENLFITHPRPLKIRQTSYTEAQEVASTYFHGDVSDHDGLLSSVLVKECVSHFVASTKVASEGTDRDCSADPSETLEFQSLHPYFARSEYTRAAVLESAHQCLRVSFDYRCKLGPNTKLTFFADSAYEKTISVFDGTSTADGRHIPDLIIHSNQFWFRFVATEDDVTKNYGYGYRFHVKPMQSISWSNESAVLEQPSLEWACWVLELILNEAKGLVARGAVHNRKIYGALVRYARSPGAPFKSRVVRILIQLLHEPDLFPLSEIPELETLEAIGNLALQRAKADRSGGRVFISAHLQQLVELSVITRRAALIFEKRLTGAANDMVIGASTISLPTPVTKAETSSVLDDFLAMSCFLLGTSDSLPGHILVSIWMEVFGSTGMIESAHPFSASTTTTGSVELNGAQTLLVTFDARCSTGEDSTLQIRCAQPSSQDEDSAPTSREFGGHEAWPSGTVAFSGDCLEYTFAAGENSDARFGVSACVFAIGLSIEQQLSRVTVGDLDKLMWRLKTQRSSSGSGLHWSPTMDGQLVDWINNHVESSSGNASSSSSIDLKPMDIRIHPTQDGLRCSQLLDVSLVDLHVRFALLKHFNQLLKESLPFLDLRDSISVSTIAHRIRQLGHCIFFDIKNTLVEAAIEATHVPGDTTSSSSNSARITLDRLQALESRDDREVEPSVSECFFAQAFRQLNQVDSSQFRRKIDNKGRLFSVKFRGEEGVDWGGVYREGVNSMVDDLFSAHFNLFVLCPNGQHDTGTNRGMYLPNPKCTSPVAIQMYEFVGKLLGISLRTHGDFPFAFPSLVWKQLIGQSLDRADLEGTDAMFVQMLDGIQNCERDGIMTEDEFETAFEGLDLRFTAFDCNGQEIELVEGGKSTRVTFENRLEYCQLAEQYRLQEGAKQVAAMARGLATIFPVRVLTLLTWHEMEMLTCGSPKIDINLWKQHTRYDGYNENDDTIKIFWEAMASFTDEQRSDFVRFAWGRSRLPRGKWPQPFKLTKKGGRDSTLSLPVAHTCFFSVELPPYTTLEKMRAMLLATINFGLGGILMA